MATLMTQPKHHPELLALMLYELPKITSDPKVFDAFMAWGDFFDRRKARIPLGYGMPPVIYVTHNWKVIPIDWAAQTWDGDVYLNALFVHQFETIRRVLPGASQVTTRSDYKSIMKEVDIQMSTAILHEIVHWGDNGFERKKRAVMYDPKRKVKFEGDAGEGFEIDAFGTKVGQALYDGTLKGWLGRDKHGWYDPTGLITGSSNYLDPDMFVKKTPR
jgi:hypothetical protein